ncbi:unnamed protein product [Diabrotica balteata]|uniref:Nose resistant-to-fluoxetine protein N-terminal domain-containing protein n=1 Tax=Diabrotica balteata TaxID=107213 RepID=A0A9N9X6E7_DIABA|nr:unnamed protein product [Diabrotica balteata]
MKFFIIFLFFIVTLVKSHTDVADTDVAHTDIAVLQDYNKWTTTVRSLLDNNTLSTECSKQFDELFKNGQADLWNFFDATSKFPWSGLAVGSYADFGNYPQCMQINHIYSGGRIKGKYCLFGLVIPSLTANFNNINLDDFFKLSVCIPDACSADDFNKIIILPLFNDQNCHTQDDVDRYTPGDKAILLTPALAMVYFFQTTIIKHMNDTPVYYALNQAVIKTCHTHWLSFFFYLQNYINYDDVFKLWCAFFIVTLGFSFIWTLSFESPLVIVEKYVFGGRASPKKARQSNNNRTAKNHLQEKSDENNLINNVQRSSDELPKNI